MNLKIEGGFLSEYDDFELWVERLEKGSKGYYIEKDDETGEYTYMRPCRISQIICLADYSSETEYNLDFEDMMQNGDFDTTAEFTTQDNCYYLGCNNDGELVPVDEIDIKDAEYC